MLQEYWITYLEKKSIRNRPHEWYLGAPGKVSLSNSNLLNTADTRTLMTETKTIINSAPLIVELR